MALDITISLTDAQEATLIRWNEASNVQEAARPGGVTMTPTERVLRYVIERLEIEAASQLAQDRSQFGAEAASIWERAAATDPTGDFQVLQAMRAKYASQGQR